MNNLAKRILVAAIAIPIVVYVAFMPYSLLGLTLIFALLAVHEFYNLAKAKGFIPQIAIGMTVTAAIVLTFAHFRLHLGGATTELLPIVLILGTIAALVSEMIKGYPNPIAQVSVTLAGALYIGMGLGGLYGVHEYFYINAARVLADAARSEIQGIDAGLLSTQ